MLRSLHSNKNGVVFVTVLVIILAMTIVTVSIISLNVNQALLTEKEYRTIQAEVMGYGAFYKTVAERYTDKDFKTYSSSQTLQNITFSVTGAIDDLNGGPNGTDVLDVLVTY
ncbi:MAG: hypothetical protein KC713_04990 [Candidatus Omnitrophica bacterium]|nr:hypothetical protein [Candidatus Omnitrophota bacterium]